jgi:hypothetical protein
MKRNNNYRVIVVLVHPKTALRLSCVLRSNRFCNINALLTRKHSFRGMKNLRKNLQISNTKHEVENTENKRNSVTKASRL